MGFEDTWGDDPDLELWPLALWYSKPEKYVVGYISQRYFGDKLLALILKIEFEN